MVRESTNGGAAGDALLGALAGCVATVPMTLAMEAMHRQLPEKERYPLPPREIAMNLAEEAQVKEYLDEGERLGLTLAAHFGMGTAAGVAYGLLGRRLPLPAPLAGAAFGLAVWAGNYLGLLPALGILRPATDHPPRRTGLMIAAHLVWGASTAVVHEAIRPRE
jgi:uncharacterized membrane protein YagU involved in acid resistance